MTGVVRHIGAIQVPRKSRDYAAEYERRMARALAKGLSRTQGRGHPKPGEPGSPTRKRREPIEDERLQRALRLLRERKSLSAAARSVHVSPEWLKQAAAEKTAITKRGRRWVVNPELPRRMPMYSRGREIVVTVGDAASASLIGRYMSAVARFLTSNNRELLQPFVNQYVTDITGKRYRFETDPNVLHRLSNASGDVFEQLYRIVL